MISITLFVGELYFFHHEHYIPFDYEALALNESGRRHITDWIPCRPKPTEQSYKPSTAPTTTTTDNAATLHTYSKALLVLLTLVYMDTVF